MGFLQNIGTTELLIILGIIVLFFGGKKINELARGLGESQKELKKVAREVKPKKKNNKDSEEENAQKDE